MSDDLIFVSSVFDLVILIIVPFSNSISSFDFINLFILSSLSYDVVSSLLLFVSIIVLLVLSFIQLSNFINELVIFFNSNFCIVSIFV